MRRALERLSAALLVALSLSVPVVTGQSAQQVWQDTLVISAGDEPQTFDPHVNVTHVGGTRMYPNIYEGLVKYDSAGRLLPSLAAAWNVSSDGLTYTFTLRQGVRFSDGTVFDGESVTFAFERLKTIGRGPVSIFSSVNRVEVVQPYVVRIVLSEPFAPFLSALGAWQGAIFMSPKMVRDNAGSDNGQRYMNDHTGGTGPYILQSWEPEKQIVLVKNPYYWARYARNGIQRVVFRSIKEPATASQLLLRGDIDILDELVPEYVDIIGRTTGVRVQVQETSGGTYGVNMQINSKKPPFTDVRVRQAIAYAIDYERVVKQVYGRLGTQARGPLPESFRPWFNRNAIQYKLDLTRARALMREAGLEGKTFRVTLGWESHNRPQRDVVQIIKENLTQIGFDVQIQEMPLAVWREVIWKNTFDLIGWGITIAFPDPDARLWRSYHSSEFRDRGFNPGFTNKRYDDLLEQARKETKFEARKRLYDDAQLLLTQEVPTVYLVTFPYTYAHRESVQGLSWIPAYGPFFAVAPVYKDPSGFPRR